MLLEQIDESRQKAITNLIDELHQVFEEYQSPKTRCQFSSICDDTLLGSLLKNLKSTGLLVRPLPPYRGISLDALSRQIQRMNFQSHCSYKNNSPYNRPCSFKLKARFDARVQEVESGLRGLVLPKETISS